MYEQDRRKPAKPTDRINAPIPAPKPKQIVVVADQAPVAQPLPLDRLDRTCAGDSCLDHDSNLAAQQGLARLAAVIATEHFAHDRIATTTGVRPRVPIHGEATVHLYDVELPELGIVGLAVSVTVRLALDPRHGGAITMLANVYDPRVAHHRPAIAKVLQDAIVGQRHALVEQIWAGAR